MGSRINPKLSFAIAAVLGGATIGAHAAAPGSTAEASADSLGEIIVTAQRRTESMQNVPIAMQAFTAQALDQLNISTFDDYVKYLPNLTTQNNGPGQNEVFMRGLSAGAQGSQGSGSTAFFPNVAIYLDNQSAQLPNRNLDIYAADLNRIEVLEGPQGTLFGAGAEAGVIRYITNEPKLNVTEGNFKAGYGTTAHGDPNSELTAVINLPLITDRAAVRGVFYNDHRGGYIDNVPATFTRNGSDLGIHYAQYATACSVGNPVNGQCGAGTPTSFGPPPGSPVINNYAIAKRAINPTTYQGVRLEALFKFNDDWDLLLSQMYQNLNTDGVFYQQPFASDGQALSPLQVTLFNDSYNRDRFSNTAWTLNGRIGALKAVYTGGYLTRHVEQVGDYTNYARGVYADYYQCYGPASGANPNLPSTCFSPSAIWRSLERNEHQQHELRLSTPDDWRLRGIAGAYWEDNKVWEQTTWAYKSIPACTSNGAAGTPGNTGCISDVGTYADSSVENPGVQPDTTSFYQDTIRETKQTAFFASVDFDLVPKVLTLTVGTRHYRFENSYAGSVLSSFYCFEQGAPAGGCQGASSHDLNQPPLSDTESGWRSRANLTWHITPNAMVYYTFSQGFRPGGFNQIGGLQGIPGPDGQWQYQVPSAYLSDKMTNNEFGWKTEFLGRRLQWNGAVYRETWKDVQIAFFDPGINLTNIYFNTNGQDFLIRGVETSLIARLYRGLTLQGAAAWNHSEQTNSPSLTDTNPASANFGQPITKTCGATCDNLQNPFGPAGSPSANSPPIQFSLRARYDWTTGDYDWFAQAGAVHVGHSFTQTGSAHTLEESVAAGGGISGRLRWENPAYTTCDASFGVGRGPWNAAVHIDNLTNSNASVNTNSDQFIQAETVLRPRVVGVTIGYKF
ncbi:MAG TPA: TonB-dependent receptor [Steroidobacteraceae bacterium]|nr:TonB-dependent receptor [Steroidobacteraceae bacterium]